MNKQTEALKMAIEFIEMHLTTNDRTFIERTATLQACKEALAQPQTDEYTEGYQQGYVEGWEAKKAEQPEQEPYAWEINHLSATSPPPYIVKHKPFYKNDSNTKVTPLYTHPAPSWQGLSDDEIMKVIEACEDKLGRHLIGGIMIARAVEQKSKEKNHG